MSNLSNNSLAVLNTPSNILHQRCGLAVDWLFVFLTSTLIPKVSPKSAIYSQMAVILAANFPALSNILSVNSISSNWNPPFSAWNFKHLSCYFFRKTCQTNRQLPPTSIVKRAQSAIHTNPQSTTRTHHNAQTQLHHDGILPQATSIWMVLALLCLLFPSSATSSVTPRLLSTL